MELFNRNSGSEVPPSQVEYQQDSGRNWRALVVYLILALLVATLVVFSGRWVYRQLSDNSPSTATRSGAPENSTQSQNGAAPSEQGKTNSATNNGASPQQTGQNPQAPGSNPSPSTPSPAPSSLPNNGPGDIVAIFVATTAAAAGLHYAVISRRSQHT